MAPTLPFAAMSASPDVAVVGAGIVGCACALFLARAGARVELHERAFVGAGTSSAGEGNVLAWDKEPARELPLALRSAALWAALAEELPRGFEYDRKGSIVVCETEAELARERARAASLPVESLVLDAAALRAEEPWCAPDLPGGVLYPGDAQLEPRLATVALAEAAVAAGVSLRLGSEVRSVSELRAGAVVVAAGVWTPSLVPGVPVRPRKGQIVVLERSPGVRFARKLSEAGYAAAVEADEEGLMVAMVVESTASGTTLLGSSRRYAGFDTAVELDVAGAIARRAARFFPVLAGLRVLRTYAGLRPFSPDHLPIVGEVAPGVCVATGHEGAGIGLAPATAELVTAWFTGSEPPLPAEWFSPARFLP
jgi:glycine/D-amino acid oxidase-like deaminating enzyme